MSVKYKSSDGWKDISSSSNNAVDAVTDGNMNPVTSNAVYDALPNKSTSTTITMTMTNKSESVTGTSVNTTLIKLGSNWGIVIGTPNVSATKSGTISCYTSMTGATLIKELSINAWQSGNTDGLVAYCASMHDFYILNCQGNNTTIYARIVALVSW